MQEGEEQPAPNGPAETEATRQDGGGQVEGAVNIGLLGTVGAIAAVGRVLARDLFHGMQYLADEIAAADRVEGNGRAGGCDGGFKLSGEVLCRTVEHMVRADPFEDGHLRIVAHDVHQRNAVFLSDAHKHLAQVGGSGGVDDGLVPFPLHGFYKAKGRHGVHEGGSALLRRHVIGQDHAGAGVHDAILREHAAADQGDALAEQGLRFWRFASVDDGAGAFIADRHGLTHPARQRATGCVGHGGDDAAFAVISIFKVGGGEKERKV